MNVINKNNKAPVTGNTKSKVKLEEKLKNLPSLPGVYQFKDSKGKVIYIGKAKNLKNRVKQYFHSKQGYRKLDVMISKIDDVELITTDTEVEALLLELNMIQKLKPRYNVNLKDDKSYPYVVITNEPYPRVFPTRNKFSDGSHYFGPYTDVKTMKFALKTIREIFMIRSCDYNITAESIEKKKYKLCLDYQIEKCEGPCEGLVSQKDYNEMIDEVAKLLNGKTATLLKELSEKMDSYSSQMLFEKAGKLRDKISALSVYSSRQKMVDEEMIDKDIFAIEKEENDGCGMILKIRDGKVIGKTHFYFSNVLEKPNEELLDKLITNYYTKTEFIPEQIHLECKVESLSSLKKWLSERRGKKVKFVIPRIGEKAKLVNMVKKNAKLMLGELKLTKLKREFIAPSVDALKRDLRLGKLPRKIECFDISHIQGTDTVASLVSFYDGKPRKSEYRKYKLQRVINDVGQPDDFLAMREVIHRRYKRIIEEKKSLPDLIVIDGGKGQLSSAVRVLEDIGIRISNGGQNVVGLAKKLEEVYLPGDSDPQTIPKTSSGLKLLQRIRDEAHRFAITFHRSLRDKRTLTTELEEIVGIGEKTARKLLTMFGSVEIIREKLKTDIEQIEKVVSRNVTKNLKEHFIID
ncbi:excinuclease ABC subunit UvrC [Bacteroidota bacterium]